MHQQIKKIVVRTVLAFALCVTSSFAMQNEGGDKEKGKKKKTPYELMTNVADKFLSPKKIKYLKKSKKNKNVLEDLKKFKEGYNSVDKEVRKKVKDFVIDLTGLSSRIRIYILRELVCHKTVRLPDEYHGGWERTDEVASNGRWHKKQRQPYSWDGYNEVDDFTDEWPVILKVGDFEYKFELGPTLNQKGSGRIYGLRNASKADGYWKVLGTLKAYKKSLNLFSKKLRKQKRDGEPICIFRKNKQPAKEVNKFLNGLNILLDYEVARRLVDNDPYSDLPIVSFLPKMTDLTKFEELFMQKGKNASLVAGGYKGNKWCTKTRKSFAKEISNKLGYIGSSSIIRQKLRMLHKMEEDSDDEYSDDEQEWGKYFEKGKEKFLKEYKNRKAEETKKKIKKLKMKKKGELPENVIARYIAGVKNDSWGGDIELGIIANVLNIRITIHRPNGQTTGITPYEEDNDTSDICLWLSGRHYQNYNPDTGIRGFILADGHCLYRAIVRTGISIPGESEIDEDEDDQERKRIELLRQLVANNMDNRDDIAVQIIGLFDTVLSANSYESLVDAIQDLPPGRLLNEALSILPNSFSFW